MAKELGTDFYFAHPYSSWERGTNENTNGLLRRFFPKGTDFDKVTQEEIDWVVDKLNNRPRKCLGFRTPNEVFWEIKTVALTT
jgi:IS30 family transposase